MSAANIAASLRSTGWSGTLCTSPTEYSETRSPPRDLSGAPRGRECPKRLDPGGSIAVLRMAGVGAQQSARALIGNSRFPYFADLHHHDLRPGKPPEGQLDGGEGNEGAQGFSEVLEVLGEATVAA